MSNDYSTTRRGFLARAAVLQGGLFEIDEDGDGDYLDDLLGLDDSGGSDEVYVIRVTEAEQEGFDEPAHEHIAPSETPAVLVEPDWTRYWWDEDAEAWLIDPASGSEPTFDQATVEGDLDVKGAASAESFDTDETTVGGGPTVDDSAEEDPHPGSNITEIYVDGVEHRLPTYGGREIGFLTQFIDAGEGETPGTSYGPIGHGVTIPYIPRTPEKAPYLFVSVIGQQPAAGDTLTLKVGHDERGSALLELQTNPSDTGKFHMVQETNLSTRNYGTAKQNAMLEVKPQAKISGDTATVYGTSCIGLMYGGV